MIGTLSMLTLVALGYAGVDLFIIIPFATLNALVGLPKQALAEGGATQCGLYGFNRALPMQMVYAGVGYGIGAAAGYVLQMIG